MAERDTPTHSWLMERRYFSLTILLAFVILSLAASSICYRHYRTSTAQILKGDRSAANLLSSVLDQHLQRIVSVMESYVQRPLLRQAVQEKNAQKAKLHLTSLTKSDPDIYILIVTDSQGTLWAAYPERPEAMGRNFAYRDWYKDVSKEWKPRISDAVLRVVREKDLAIQIGVPFVNEKGEAVGILLCTLRTTGFAGLFKQVPLDAGVRVTLADRKGQIIYSSFYGHEKEIRPYPFHGDMKKTMAAKNRTFTVDAPDLGGRSRHISFSPVGALGFTVFVERDGRSILLSEADYYMQVAMISFLLFLTIVLFLFYLRKQVTAQQLHEQLLAEAKLHASEMRFRELFDNINSGVAIYKASDDGADFIILELNEAARRITQVDTDFVGKSVCDVFPGVKTFGLLEVFRRVWETGKGEYFPPSQYQDGRLSFWVENRVYKLRSNQIIAVFDDVTERVRAEAELRLLNQRLETEVAEKTKDLQARIAALERFHEATIEREFRIKELRDEIERLKGEPS